MSEEKSAETPETATSTQEPIAEAPRNKFKVAAPPHYISIALSILALLVSLLSWWESHSARLISQGSNRALAYVTELQNVKMPFDTPGPVYKVVVRNFGRSAAKGVRYWFKVTVANYMKPKESEYQSPQFEQLWAELPPGMQRETELNIPWGAPGTDKTIPEPTKDEDQYIIGVLEYTDEPTGNTYQQRWCFRLETVASGIEPCY
ncbi:MAG: hypothetical protein M3247_08735 [Thermoproteota archaeon]|nr:hypothetical protein [Acidobacteriota bacterium]MDQ3903709.1 hypothetical protein [Thermoproteota archaeon]